MEKYVIVKFSLPPGARDTKPVKKSLPDEKTKKRKSQSQW